jgi:hypothetical protein
MHDNLLKFKKLVEPWLAGYSHVNASVFGARDNDKRWVLASRILLLPPWSPSVKSPSLESRVFWGRTENIGFGAKDLEPILAALDEGVVRLGSIDCSLSTDPQSPMMPATFYPGHPVSHDRDPAAVRSPMLQKVGGSKATLIHRLLESEDLEWHLRTLDPPFVDLKEAYLRFGVPAERYAEQSIIEFYAYPPIEICRDSTIRAGVLTLRIRKASALDKKRVSIGYIAQGTNRRGVIRSTAMKWRGRGPVLEGTAELKVADAPAVLCFLNYADTGLQQVWIVDPKRVLNKHTAIYSAFDNDFDHLRELLFDPKKERDARRFEDGVALLFNMLGFSVTQHGRSQRLRDGPDILAFTPSGILAVVECTTGMPDEGDQVAAIKKRVARIRRSLNKTGWKNLVLQPVIVTPLSQVDTAEHRDDAESKGVLVLCHEDIEDALRQIQLAPDADKYLDGRLTDLRPAHLFSGR